MNTAGTETIRYVGRCRSCQHRGTVDALVRATRVQGRDYVLHVLPVTDADRPHLDPFDESRGRDMRYEWVLLPPISSRADMSGVRARVFKRLGLWCGCNKELRLSPVAATADPQRRCDARCRSAVSITCDCSCGGAGHGARWLVAASNVLVEA